MNFLPVYQSTLHPTAGVAPCILFLKREVRTCFHLLPPELKDQVMSQQATQKFQHVILTQLIQRIMCCTESASQKLPTR